jgi:hypothetical protein
MFLYNIQNQVSVVFSFCFFIDLSGEMLKHFVLRQSVIFLKAVKIRTLNGKRFSWQRHVLLRVTLPIPSTPREGYIPLRSNKVYLSGA